MLQQIASAVHAYIQPHGGWCVSNAGVLVGKESVTLIDCTATEHSAGRLRQEIRTLTAAPVSRIVLTHHHGDHHHGASVFRAPLVIAHEHTRTQMLDEGINLPGIWPDTDWGDIHLNPPNLTFTDQICLDIDGLAVELIHYGPAHTTGDIVVWIPQYRILFAGDLTFSDSTPFVFMGSLAGTLTALDQLRELDPETVVSGHGPITGPEVIDDNADYLHWVNHLASNGITAGWTPLETATRSDLRPYAHLSEPERLVANLHRAYAEHHNQPTAKPLPIPPALADMTAYNGGSPLPCAA
ncbi:MBL fold metallo-hydrolase [Streptomyces sp. N35]|uniref:MBL fold metallo-hydrolase n=1 Tax=Streptomyces sp. N35 TaxID=2795730 RepID=UPI0018F5431E|nr:MBL fold metallo-hydrolase [Streptomyces sp. N35]